MLTSFFLTTATLWPCMSLSSKVSEIRRIFASTRNAFSPCSVVIQKSSPIENNRSRNRYFMPPRLLE